MSVEIDEGLSEISLQKIDTHLNELSHISSPESPKEDSELSFKKLNLP
jgi:hypothetical protein